MKISPLYLFFLHKVHFTNLEFFFYLHSKFRKKAYSKLVIR